MPTNITARFAFETTEPTDILLQFEAAIIPEQRLLSSQTTLSLNQHFARVAAEDDIGERIWVRMQGRFDVEYTASVEVQRLLPEIGALSAMPPHKMPGGVVKYVFESRYCPASRFYGFVEDQFAGTSGGARVLAIRDWIEEHFTYDSTASGPNTSGADSFIERRGVCRDYAHVLIMLARASTIPARYVSCFAAGVDPQDFHAVAEVFLADENLADGGSWHLVDATGMTQASQVVKIGVGRDAADVSFMSSFGQSEFIFSEVEVSAE